MVGSEKLYDGRRQTSTPFSEQFEDEEVLDRREQARGHVLQLHLEGKCGKNNQNKFLAYLKKSEFLIRR